MGETALPLTENMKNNMRSLAFCILIAAFCAAQSNNRGSFLIQLEFNHRDRDGDGLISSGEFRQSPLDEGATDSAVYVAEYMALADRNGDGGIDLEEYAA